MKKSRFTEEQIAFTIKQHELCTRAVNEINKLWSMDFVADNLFDRRKLRMLTVVDCYSRECLAIHVGQSFKGESVANVLGAIRCSASQAPDHQIGQRQAAPGVFERTLVHEPG